MTPKLLLPLLLLALLAASCGLASSPQELDEGQIKDILYDIESKFNANDIDGLMDHVHSDYYHNSMYGHQLRLRWLDLRARYELLDITDLEVEVEADFATAGMRLTFHSATGDLSYLEPDSVGDISYFYYDDGVWQIIGNRQAG